MKQIELAILLLLMGLSGAAIAAEVGAELSGSGGGLSAWGWLSLSQSWGSVGAAERVRLSLSPVSVQYISGQLNWKLPSPDWLPGSLTISGKWLGTGRLDLSGLASAGSSFTWGESEVYWQVSLNSYWAGVNFAYSAPQETLRGKAGIKGKLLTTAASVKLPLGQGAPGLTLSLSARPTEQGDVTLRWSKTLSDQPAGVSLNFHATGAKLSGGATFTLSPVTTTRAFLEASLPWGKLKAALRLSTGRWQLDLGVLRQGRPTVEIGGKLATDSAPSWFILFRYPLEGGATPPPSP